MKRRTWLKAIAAGIVSGTVMPPELSDAEQDIVEDLADVIETNDDYSSSSSYPSFVDVSDVKSKKAWLEHIGRKRRPNGNS